MCRLYAEKVDTSDDSVEIRVVMTLKGKDMLVLKKEVERFRKWQKSRGYEPNYTERDEIIYAIHKRLEELRVRHTEEEYDAVEYRNYKETSSFTGEVQHSHGSTPVECGNSFL